MGSVRDRQVKALKAMLTLDSSGLRQVPHVHRHVGHSQEGGEEVQGHSVGLHYG